MPVIAAQDDSFEKVQAKLSETLSMLREYYRNYRLRQKLMYRAFSRKNREAMRKSHVRRDAIETIQILKCYFRRITRV